MLEPMHYGQGRRHPRRLALKAAQMALMNRAADDPT
jgi:hypothetical protein